MDHRESCLSTLGQDHATFSIQAFIPILFKLLICLLLDKEARKKWGRARTQFSTRIIERPKRRETSYGPSRFEVGIKASRAIYLPQAPYYPPSPPCSIHWRRHGVKGCFISKYLFLTFFMSKSGNDRDGHPVALTWFMCSLAASGA